MFFCFCILPLGFSLALGHLIWKIHCLPCAGNEEHWSWEKRKPQAAAVLSCPAESNQPSWTKRRGGAKPRLRAWTRARGAGRAVAAPCPALAGFCECTALRAWFAFALGEPACWRHVPSPRSVAAAPSLCEDLCHALQWIFKLPHATALTREVLKISVFNLEGAHLYHVLTEASHGENPGVVVMANACCMGSQGCAHSCVGGDCSLSCPEHQPDVTSHEFLSPLTGWL